MNPFSVGVISMSLTELIAFVVYFLLLSTKTDLNRHKLLNGRHLYPFKL